MKTLHAVPESGPRRLSREARRSQFLDIAAALVVDHGADAVTMEGVAAAAGVSKGLGYAYFANRDELLVAMLDREMEYFEAEMLGVMADAPSVEAQFRAAIDRWLDLVVERGAVVAALAGPSLHSGPLEARRQEHTASIVAMFASMLHDEYAMARGRSLAAAAIMLSGATGVFELYRLRPASRQQLVDTYVTMTMGAFEALRDS